LRTPKEISRYIRLHFGNLVTAEETAFTDEHWETDLKVDYPAIIQDDRTNERIIRFLSFKKLGHLRFSENFRVPEGNTTNEECAGLLHDYLGKWRERAEKIVVEATAPNLARSERMRDALNPIYVLVYNLITEPETEITQVDIARFRRPRKTRQYLSLLEQSGIVHKTQSGYSYGNMFTAIVKKVKEQNPKDYVAAMTESVIAYIIRQNYPVIREVFRVSRLEPVVHMDSCYYEQTLKAGKLVYQEMNKLIDRYNQVYPRMSPKELKPVLHELVEINTLTQDDDYFYGVPPLFAEMQQMQNEVPEFAALIA
jgi:hypothetical protein